MRYIVQLRKVGETRWLSHFEFSSLKEIVKLEEKLPGYELKISTGGEHFDTMYHPHSGVLVRDILDATLNVAPIDAPFSFSLNAWSHDEYLSYSVEEIIRWTVDNLVGLFGVESIIRSPGESPNREIFTVNCVRA